MIRTLLLIDGEHYPPVIAAVFPRLEAEGRRPIAAFFLGGFEKTGSPPDLPVPVHSGDPVSLVPELIGTYDIDLVLDLSDEPVLDPRRRFVLAGLALAAGASYAGGGFILEPPPRPRLTEIPSVAVIGTGKRTGKTALAIELARHWRGERRRPVIVTMGRGGPPEPLVLRPSELDEPRKVMERLIDQGLHATSDYVEDALFASVGTVGTRRLGAGPAGATVDDAFEAGVAVAEEELDPGLLIFEGSGAAVPPAEADATVLVTRDDLDPEFLVGYLGTYRLAISDVLVVIGESTTLEDAIGGIVPDLVVLHARLYPQPTVPVAGRRVAVVTTARPSAGEAISSSLIEEGAESVTLVHSLSDRRRLRTELAEVVRVGDLVLTEIKAAAADMVLPVAEDAGAEIGFLHNRVEIAGGLERLIMIIETKLGADSTSRGARSAR